MEVAEAHRAFEEWRNDFINRLNAAYREGHLLLKDGPDMEHLTEGQTVAIQRHETFEYWSDSLSHGTPEEQAQIYKERGAIAKWIEKALSD